MAKTVFVTYNFEGAPFSGGTSLGINESLHCNYIQRLQTDTITGKDLNFYFPPDAFPFLNDMTLSNGTGWTATKINALVQVVDGTGSTINPTSFNWKKVDVTSQLANHTGGTAISENALLTTVFKVTFNQVNAAPIYNLSYLNYPTSLPIDVDRLSFGEESFFFGNVKTDIGATVYTTDIAINLPLGNYNSTTNPTWNGTSSLYISEVGIFSDINELIAIGKLNYPIQKDSTKFRTILFSLDF